MTTTYPPEAATDALVRDALAMAFAPVSELELVHLSSRVRVTRAPVGAPLYSDGSPELRVVVLGVVSAGERRFLPGHILPAPFDGAPSEPLRVQREAVVVHLPYEALEGWAGHRVLHAIARGAAARPEPKMPPLVVGISSDDPRLALVLHESLAEALRRHGTVSITRLETRDAQPTRLALETLLPRADFQIVVLPGPSTAHDAPAVDRWLFVADGDKPGDGRPMPKRRVAADGASHRPPHHAATSSVRFRPTRGEAGLSPRTLVLSHDPSRKLPRRTERHLAFHKPDEHRHVRRGHAGDHARIARELAGVPIGFALGAGGARGLAHLGVLQAAEELGIPIDHLSGTSIGAALGALVGLGMDVYARRAAAEKLARARPFSDFTLPTTALLRGKKFEALAVDFFGGHDLADLWVPLVTRTCELGDFEEVVHTQGPLDALILAGTVLPGILPPRVLGGKLHVDGGTSDMLPVELLRQRTPGPIVAVDVSPWDPISVPEGGYPVGASALFARLRGRPALLGALQVFWRGASYLVAARSRAEGRAADLLITPAVGDIGTSDLDALRHIEQAGYVAAQKAFASEPARVLTSSIGRRRECGKK